MNSQEALEIINQILSPQSLSHIQELVFERSWNQKTYKEIAVDIGYDSDYVKEIGSELWQVLSHAFGRRVTKKNVQIMIGEEASRLGKPAIAAQESEFSLLGASLLSPASLPPRATTLPLQASAWHYFEDYLHQEWQQLLADAVWLSELIPTLTSLSLILCGIDHLQIDSDTFDLEARDLYLQQVADTLQQHLKRPKDLLAYYPTGKFAILLPQTNARGAVSLAGRMRVAINQLRISHTGSPMGVITVSLGVATTSPDPKATPNDLLTAGIQALQQAKQQGCDQVMYKSI
jgi:diguanylate cyclase (GGDEF)-like protein